MVDTTELRELEGRTVKCPMYAASLLKKKATYTAEEIMKHNTRDDIWISIDGKVFDVTKFLKSHPGGSTPMLALAGRDATDAFANYHPSTTYEKYLPAFYIGEVADYKVTPFVAGHRAIRQQLLSEGLFETDPSYYIKYTIWLVSIFTAAVGCVVFGSSMMVRMLGALFIALFWQQVAFLGHDVGHNAITHVRHTDSRMGIFIGNVSQGIAMAWWKWSHNLHHVTTNSIDLDPDIQHMPFIAVGMKVFDFYREKFHPSVFADSIARYLVSKQHILFYPIMLSVARFNLYIQSYIFLLTWPEHIHMRVYEIIGQFVFMAWYSLLVSCLPTTAERVIFVLLSHSAAGVLHIQIVLSHFAMPTYRGQAYNGEKDEWFHMQIATSLNIRTPRLLDWVHGGLHFQVEHHLYPRLPRHNLRYASKLVRAYAAKHGIKYSLMNFFEANADLVRSLKEVAKSASELAPEKAPGFFDKIKAQ